MKRVLFVSNGHGEAAIADRIAGQCARLLPDAQCDHLALVGTPECANLLPVGPQREMPSGGLIAMGNIRNFIGDVGAGLLGLVTAQWKFVRAARGTYPVAVAVGDAYALAMTLGVAARTVFVGTAKSIRVAPYGRFEKRLLRRAAACFVRDDITARALREAGISAVPANVIADLYDASDPAAADAAVRDFAPALALFPGSRSSAYDDGRYLLAVVRELIEVRPALGGVLSVAPGLDAQRFEADARRDGWETAGGNGSIAFALHRNGRTAARAWTGPLGPLLRRVVAVLGQAGTANEAAAAAGVPVIAFARERNAKARWYRQRQQGLLGDALVVLYGDAKQTCAGVGAVLDDAQRRRHMSETGRAVMGPPGGTARIAGAVAELMAAS